MQKNSLFSNYATHTVAYQDNIAAFLHFFPAIVFKIDDELQSDIQDILPFGNILGWGVVPVG